jgi:hypothetical protein
VTLHTVKTNVKNWFVQGACSHRVQGQWIRDGNYSDPGSKSRDKHPGSATLVCTVVTVKITC